MLSNLVDATSIVVLKCFSYHSRTPKGVIENMMQTSDSPTFETYLPILPSVPYQYLALQVLWVVNPYAKYKVPTCSQEVRGVAIILKEFLGLLNEYSIPHVGQKELRQQV